MMQFRFMRASAVCCSMILMWAGSALAASEQDSCAGLSASNKTHLIAKKGVCQEFENSTDTPDSRPVAEYWPALMIKATYQYPEDGKPAEVQISPIEIVEEMPADELPKSLDPGEFAAIESMLRDAEARDWSYALAGNSAKLGPYPAAGVQALGAVATGDGTYQLNALVQFDDRVGSTVASYQIAVDENGTASIQGIRFDTQNEGFEYSVLPTGPFSEIRSVTFENRQETAKVTYAPGTDGGRGPKLSESIVVTDGAGVKNVNISYQADGLYPLQIKSVQTRSSENVTQIETLEQKFSPDTKAVRYEIEKTASEERNELKVKIADSSVTRIKYFKPDGSINKTQDTSYTNTYDAKGRLLTQVIEETQYDSKGAGTTITERTSVTVSYAADGRASKVTTIEHFEKNPQGDLQLKSKGAQLVQPDPHSAASMNFKVVYQVDGGNVVGSTLQDSQGKKLTFLSAEGEADPRAILTAYLGDRDVAARALKDALETRNWRWTDPGADAVLVQRPGQSRVISSTKSPDGSWTAEIENSFAGQSRRAVYKYTVNDAGSLQLRTIRFNPQTPPDAAPEQAHIEIGSDGSERMHYAMTVVEGQLLRTIRSEIQARRDPETGIVSESGSRQEEIAFATNGDRDVVSSPEAVTVRNWTASYGDDRRMTAYAAEESNYIRERLSSTSFENQTHAWQDDRDVVCMGEGCPEPGTYRTTHIASGGTTYGDEGEEPFSWSAEHTLRYGAPDADGRQSLLSKSGSMNVGGVELQLVYMLQDWNVVYTAVRAASGEILEGVGGSGDVSPADIANRYRAYQGGPNGPIREALIQSVKDRILAMMPDGSSVETVPETEYRIAEYNGRQRLTLRVINGNGEPVGEFSGDLLLEQQSADFPRLNLMEEARQHAVQSLGGNGVTIRSMSDFEATFGYDGVPGIQASYRLNLESGRPEIIGVTGDQNGNFLDYMQAAYNSEAAAGRYIGGWKFASYNYGWDSNLSTSNPVMHLKFVSGEGEMVDVKVNAYTGETLQSEMTDRTGKKIFERRFNEQRQLVYEYLDNLSQAWRNDQLIDVGILSTTHYDGMSGQVIYSEIFQQSLTDHLWTQRETVNNPNYWGWPGGTRTVQTSQVWDNAYEHSTVVTNTGYYSTNSVVSESYDSYSESGGVKYYRSHGANYDNTGMSWGSPTSSYERSEQHSEAGVWKSGWESSSYGYGYQKTTYENYQGADGSYSNRNVAEGTDYYGWNYGYYGYGYGYGGGTYSVTTGSSGGPGQSTIQYAIYSGPTYPSYSSYGTSYYTETAADQSYSCTVTEDPYMTGNLNVSGYVVVNGSQIPFSGNTNNTGPITSPDGRVYTGSVSMFDVQGLISFMREVPSPESDDSKNRDWAVLDDKMDMLAGQDQSGGTSPTFQQDGQSFEGWSS